MLDTIRPAGLATAGRGDARKDAFGTRPLNSQSERPVQAQLSGSNICAAAGITACGHAPVLVLCRDLIAAGCDPDRAMQVFRNATLALRIRSIGEAAQLEINSKGTGFVKAIHAVRTGPSVRAIGGRAVS